MTIPGFTPDGAYIPQPQDLVDIYPERLDDIPTPLAFRTRVDLLSEAIIPIFVPPGPGVVLSNGTILETATLSPGLSLDLTSQTLSNTGVLEVTAGAGITIVGTNADETISNAGVLAIGGAVGNIVVGFGLMIASNTLSATNSGQPYEYGTVSWGGGAIAANGTITLGRRWPQNTHVTIADFSNGSSGGSIALQVRIDGTPVTGLSSVTIGSAGTATASGANELAAGAHVLDLVFTAASGTIADGGAVTLSGTYD